MQTAPVFKQASIRPGNKTVPAHLVLFSAGSLRQTVQQCWEAGRAENGDGKRKGREAQLQCQKKTGRESLVLWERGGEAVAGWNMCKAH